MDWRLYLSHLPAVSDDVDTIHRLGVALVTRETYHWRGAT